MHKHLNLGNVKRGSYYPGETRGMNFTLSITITSTPPGVNHKDSFACLHICTHAHLLKQPEVVTDDNHSTLELLDGVSHGVDHLH